ncbi:MAG: rhodanese-like domain-containing protein [Nitrospirota bacterium]
MKTMRKGFVMALAALFVMAGVAFAEQFSAKAMKTSDEMKNLAGQKVEMPAAMAGAKNITTDELKKWLDEGKAVVILDNRPAKEYEAEHIPGAKRVGVDELLKNGPKEAEAAGVKKDDIIVNYCNGIKCWRSPASSTLLLDAGYKNIYWYRDGIPEWIRKGYDTAAGKEAGSWKKK